MTERIKRKDDEGLYQPAIHSRRIRQLYALKVETGTPLTVLLDQAIEKYLDDIQARQVELAHDQGNTRTDAG